MTPAHYIFYAVLISFWLSSMEMSQYESPAMSLLKSQDEKLDQILTEVKKITKSNV